MAFYEGSIYGVSRKQLVTHHQFVGSLQDRGTEDFQVNPSPEWKLLLSCARTNIDEEELKHIGHQLVHANLDWDRVAERACQHGIAPLVYYNLQRLGVTSVIPKDAVDELERSYYGNAARNTLLYQELNKVLKALKEIGSEIIVLKGAALAETVYSNRALRPMSDIDLLVRKEDLPRVENHLVAMGYLLHQHPRPKEWLKEHDYHLAFIKNETTPIEIHCEIHWHIERPSRPFKIDIEGMWERALAAKIAGVEALVLSPEDLLLHLCLHTCKHKLTFFGPRSLCDISETLRYHGQAIDWGQVQNRSYQWCINQYVYLTLHLAKELLGAAVPEPVLASLKPEDFDARLLDWAKEEMLEDKGSSPIFPDLLRVWKARRFKDMMALLLEPLTLEAIAKCYAVSPTSKKIYFYYPVRLKDLLLRYGPVLWRLFCRDRQLTALAERKARLDEWLADFSVSTPERVSEKW